MNTVELTSEKLGIELLNIRMKLMYHEDGVPAHSSDVVVQFLKTTFLKNA